MHSSCVVLQLFSQSADVQSNHSDRHLDTPVSTTLGFLGYFCDCFYQTQTHLDDTCTFPEKKAGGGGGKKNQTQYT